jgi:hypothetical protein
MAYRISAPFSSSGDFRYIFPALIPLLYFYSYTVGRHKIEKRITLANVGLVAGWGFVLMAFSFMICLFLGFF